MNKFKQHKEGIILSLLFHAILIVILFQFGFFTPLPLPEDKGVLVDFGMNDSGLGKVEPKPKPKPVEQLPEEQPQQEQITPPEPVKSNPVAEAEPEVNQANEEVLTQNYEETAAIEEGKRKEEEERKKREEIERKRKQEEADKKQKEKLEQQRKEELARIEREANEQRQRDSIRKIEEARLAELRRIAEKRRQDSIAQAQKQAKIDAINERAQNVFGGGSNASSSTSQSQGVTYEGGNQGTTTGTAGANKYGLGGGEGISFNLIGRSAENLQRPSYPGQEEGIVVVQVTVDKTGKVTKAEPGVKGSTSLDAGLLNAAKQAALTTRFNEAPNAAAFQTGTITYSFVLN